LSGERRELMLRRQSSWPHRQRRKWTRTKVERIYRLTLEIWSSGKEFASWVLVEEIQQLMEQLLNEFMLHRKSQTFNAFNKQR